MINEITDKEFEQEVTKSNLPVIIDFWAPWCGPCKMLAPILEQLVNEVKEQVKIVKMNIDDNPETPSRLGIRSIPTLMLFKNGKEVATKTGLHSKEILLKWLNENIAAEK